VIPIKENSNKLSLHHALISCAHPGEAKVLLERGHFLPFNFVLSGVYYSEDWKSFLIITGEGTIKATQKLSAFLGYWFQNQLLKTDLESCKTIEPLNSIINIGVAGILDKSLLPLQIVFINNSYLQPDPSDRGPATASQTSQFHDAHLRQPLKFLENYKKMDCISAHQRVLNENYANELAPFAPVVDRELWAISKISKIFKLPWSAFKFVIDYADENACQLTRNHAADYNAAIEKLLIDLSQDNGDLVLSAQQNQKAETSLEQIKSQLYLSHSQKIIFEKLEKTFKEDFPQVLKRSWLTIESEFNMAKKDFQKLTPKLKAKILIEKLQSEKSPFMAEIIEKMNTINLPLKKNNIQVSWDKQLSSNEVKLMIPISSFEEWVNIQKSLNEWPYSTLKKLLDGEIFPNEI
jgi:hypothetical protein